MSSCRLAHALAAALALAGPAAHADALSAAQVRAAAAAGALLWDVRDGAGEVIAGATRLPATTVGRWLEGGDLAALAGAVSAAGLDLSRDIVVYGHAGDALAQALHAALPRVARAQVHWLVGGIEEWRTAGLPTSTTPAVRWPVPQHLVATQAVGNDGVNPLAPAAPALRRSEDPPTSSTRVTVARH